MVQTDSTKAGTRELIFLVTADSQSGLVPYAVHFDLVEVSQDGTERHLAARTVKTVEGNPAQFTLGAASGTLAGESAPPGGVHC